MNKLEASFALLSVTFFWRIQYMFPGNILKSIFTFTSLTLTNVIGSILVASIFYKEFMRITRKLVWKSFLTAVLLFELNVLLTMGSRSTETSTASFLATAYITLILVVMVVLRKKMYRRSMAGVLMALIGIFLATGIGFGAGGGGMMGLSGSIFCLLGADIFSAVYIAVLEELADDLSPVLLSMGQMFFDSLFELRDWLMVQPETIVNLSMETQFWTNVLVIAALIRGFIMTIQVYVQRYVSALNTSLIFSMEIAFTLVSMQLLPLLPGEGREPLTTVKIYGCLCTIVRALVSEGVIRVSSSRRRQG